MEVMGSNPVETGLSLQLLYFITARINITSIFACTISIIDISFHNKILEPHFVL